MAPGAHYVALVPDRERWTVEHSSQANPVGQGQESVPALLRRVAASLEALGDVAVHDITSSMDMDREGRDRPTATVHFSDDDS